MKILIIEDNGDLSESIKQYLSAEGHLCEQVSCKKEAIDNIVLYDYDCVVLDLSLPDGNGLDILSRLKALNKEDGVIIISAKDALDDRVKGLRLGADDYLIKPFHLAELSVRAMAIFRRRRFKGNNTINVGLISVDLQSKMVVCAGKEVEPFTPKEFELLLFLLSSKNRVLSKSSIAEHLLGESADFLDSFDFVYAHIKNIKRKLRKADCPDYIKTVYGMGYKFTLDE